MKKNRELISPKVRRVLTSKERDDAKLSLF